ncbi:hypothetical protein V8C86DRAFT_3031224 [Haematococcus lacustris]
MPATGTGSMPKTSMGTTSGTPGGRRGGGGLAALLEPYLLSLQGSSASKGLVVADLGCGSSLLGHQLARHCGAPTHLLLLDASPLPLMRSRQTHYAASGPPDRQPCAAPAEPGARLSAQAVAVEQQQAPPHVGLQAEEPQAGCGTGLGGGAGCAVSWVQGDCRALPLRSASVDLLLDKVRFLALLGRDFGAVPHDPSALTCALLARLAASGSLLESDDEASPCDGGEGGTLFDA